ncbi:MAG: hypothetical protein HY866_00430 [Chloroflexi bacterium]|nr:hypothetical protein [Chloroflexota bacterium]
MEPHEIFPLLGQTSQAIGTLYGPEYEKKTESYDLPGGVLYALVISSDFQPDDTSAARFLVRTPYAHWKMFSDNLAALAERGLVEPTGPGTYRITPPGHQIVHELEDCLNTLLAQHQPLPAADLERTAALLGKLVESALHASQPAAKPSLTANRHSDPGPQGAVLLRILQYLADMNSYRDDAHLAAWRPLGVSGPAWEGFSFIWREEAKTAAELGEKLAHRRFTADDYARLLNELVDKRWLTVSDEGYALTETGTALRQQIEDLSNQYYFEAWKTFDKTELNDLGNLLTRLQDSIKTQVETAQPA